MSALNWKRVLSEFVDKIPGWRSHTPKPRRKYNRQLLLEPLETRQLLAADFLYIGDTNSDSVQKFNADTGAYIGSFVTSGSAGLHGPRGMVPNAGNLLVVNQNVGLPKNGEVLRYDGQTGAALPALVPSSSANAPFSPAGIVVRNNVVYVADTRDDSASGRIAKYNATTGAFLGDLIPSAFDGEFRPRGLVFGPDGGLYVSVFSEALYYSADPAGYILRFDTTTGAYGVVARNNGDGQGQPGETALLHNPEGLVFGPNGRIYVTANRIDPSTSIEDNTHVLIIDPATGSLLDSVSLAAQTRPDNPTRIFAQAILFGPNGKLFIPITERSLNDGLQSGGVWTYDPATKQIATLVAPSLFDPPLEFPYYLTFGKTDPATLNYASTAPLLGGAEGTALDYSPNAAAARITASLTVSDSDSANIASARIVIAANYQSGHDVLTFTNTAKITGTWNQATGTLTLAGVDSVANYQTALRNVKFQSSATGVRTISFQVSDGAYNSNLVTRDVRVSFLRADYLFIGDQGDPANPADDTVKQFDITSGSLVGVFVAPGRLIGPRGMAFNAGNLLVVNQNVNTPFNGEVLRFDGKSGSALPPTVPSDASQAPFAPRGIVVKDGVLFVADFEGAPTPRIAKYDAATGAFIGNLIPNGFSPEFRPRGLVFGPDGKLYVSVFSETSYASQDAPGYILRFTNTTTGAFEVVAANNGDGVHPVGEIADLHNPEGLVFGPDGRLYVTSFRVDATDNKILVLDVGTKTQRDSIPLGQYFAQALLFGPNDKLLVPLTGGGSDAGSVRAYDVATKNFTTLLGKLQQPWYLTFTQTNPATLAYQPWHNFVNPLDTDGDGHVVPLDALIVINEVNTPTVTDSLGHLPSSRPTANFYFDVNQDGFAVPLDALIVINFLNGNPQAEGEARSLTPQTSSNVTSASLSVAGVSSLVSSSLASQGLSVPLAPSGSSAPAVKNRDATATPNTTHASMQLTKLTGSVSRNSTSKLLPMRPSSQLGKSWPEIFDSLPQDSL